MDFSLSELKVSCYTKLEDRYSKRELESIFYYLCEDTLGLNRAALLINPPQHLPSDKVKDFLNCLEQLESGKPYQYVMGKAPFRHLELNVNENVLIPRPETEELVQLLLDKSQGAERILDIGTGSGCIALSIAQELPKSEVVAIDVSKEALQTAKNNASELGLKVNFQLMGMEEDLSSLGQFSRVISNPPYIGTDELGTLEEHVSEFEPHLALFSKSADPLFFYKVIRDQLSKILVEGGIAFLECHENYARETALLFDNNAFSEVTIINDLMGKQRFVSLVKT